jgi:CheY-like chemotaxis protein
MSALRKLLVVDDDPVVGKSFNRVLSGKGYIVVTAENGAEALERLAKEEYDAVYTDIKMPGMSGLEVAENIKARRPWTPVVIVTGYGSAENEARAEAAGVVEFIHKPLSPELIESSAKRVLSRERAAPVEAVALPAEAAAEVAPEAAGVAEEEATAEAGAMSAAKNVALFFAAPFIGLAYILAFPFVGLGMLAWMATKAAAKNDALRTTGRVAGYTVLLFAAPLIGLAYILLLPVIGFAMLARAGAEGLMKRTTE